MGLLDPVTLGSGERTRELRNRLVFGPHETNLGQGRTFSDRHVAYYGRRAAGGAGLVVTEIASVHDLDWPYERSPLWSEAGPGWSAIGAACRAEGATVVAGLGHAGLQGSSAYSQRELWAPSPVPDAVTREMPKEMEEADIAAVVDGFGSAAALAMDSGLDGVEINAGQHSLVRQFLSGLTNLRSDRWGPDDDGLRLGFATAVLDAVRRGVGDGLVGLRLSCDELAPWAGLTPESATTVAGALAPLVDYLVVVRGSIFSVDATRPDAHVPAGFNLDLARDIRTAVNGACAVVAQGSIVDPGQAEWAIEDGRADLVEMTRAQIADPDLATRWARPGAGGVRPCILCNQRCRVRDARNPIVTCTVNPSAGHETIDPEGPAQHGTGRLVVVGAGPAGLECARVAARAGVEVTVVDARDETGALVRDWTTAIGREPLVGAVDWLTAECERLDVTIEHGRTVSADDIRSWHEDGIPVVVATGSHPRSERDVEHVDGTLLSAADLLAARRRGQNVLPDGPVLVWDPVGGPVAVSVAETLAAAGDRVVHFACPDVTAGTLLSLTGDLATASTRMLQAGITIHRHVRLRVVGADRAELVDTFTDARIGIDVVAVVDCGTRVPADELWHDTAGTARLVGDAMAPRTIFEAVLEGRRAAIDVVEGSTHGTGPDRRHGAGVR